MLFTIAVILIILWALGLITSYTLGGFKQLSIIHRILSVNPWNRVQHYQVKFIQDNRFWF